MLIKDCSGQRWMQLEEDCNNPVRDDGYSAQGGGREVVKHVNCQEVF